MLKFLLGVGAGVAGVFAVQYVVKQVRVAKANAANTASSQLPYGVQSGGMINRGQDPAITN